MKRVLLLLLSALMILSAVSCAENGSTSDSSTDGKGTETMKETETTKPYVAFPPDASNDKALQWLRDRIETDTLFSFQYQGASFQSFIGTWQKDLKETAEENGNLHFTLTYRSPEKVVAWAEIDYLKEYSVVEWCVYFKNEGEGKSPVISVIRAINAPYALDGIKLTSTVGSSTKVNDFTPFTYEMAKVQNYYTENQAGRSSSCAFPYYELWNGEEGVFGALGWTGDWSASFAYADGAVTVDAGMKRTNIALYAGEEMRAPSMTMMFYEGDQDAGHNKFRRLILTRYTPDGTDGQPITQLPLIMSGTNRSETEIYEYLQKCQRLGVPFDTLWIDAGWSGESQYTWNQQVGNWYFNKDLFPHGLAAVSDKLAENGQNLLLWFEPERARPNSWIVETYPQYFLPTNDANTMTFDFTSDEATDFMIAFIGGFIEENKLTWYRQDCNLNITQAWTLRDRKEGTDRVGMSEIRYITNLYRYLDALLANHEGLIIDNCASGGLRLDIEMMRRSVPLWRTDYTVASGSQNSTMDEVRNIATNLSWWLPLSGGHYASEGLYDDYTWRSVMGSAAILGFYSLTNTFYPDGMQQYLTYRRYMAADYYILAQGAGEELTTAWSAFEYYFPRTGEGMMTIFRPGDCKSMRNTFRLKGLDAEATYTVRIYDTGETYETTGRDLMENGITVKFKTALARASLLIYFERV
ncbi:MAG: alpha-galactosidase [Ruminococcaceae bacterium]|nr:alpha-galactosidase [Oscillospiraceae bacterium]